MRGRRRVVLVGHAGKLVKVAAGVWNTHSRVADARLETLAALAAAAGAPPTLVVELLELPTVEAAVEVLAAAGLTDVWDDVADRAARRAGERMARRSGGAAPPSCDCAVVAYDGEIIGRSAALRAELGGRRARSPDAARWSSRSWAPARARPTGSRRRPGAPSGAPTSSWAGAASSSVSRPSAPSASWSAPTWTRSPPPCAAAPGGASSCWPAATPGSTASPSRSGVCCRSARIVTLPGISSVQLAAARLGRPWHDLMFASAHGLDVQGVVAAVAEHPRVLALTDAARTPQALARALVAAGIGARLTVLERLGEPDEQITTADAAVIAAGRFDGLSVVFIEREEPA